VRCRVAVQRDCSRAALLAFDRFAEERLGGRDIALGAQPEVDRPARPINGTIQVAPLASNLDVCLVDPAMTGRLTGQTGASVSRTPVRSAAPSA
jgi:hypothetical protein